MPMSKLHFAPEAQNDLDEIQAYIAEELDNPQAAQSTVGKIMKSIRLLLKHSLIGASLSSIANVDSDYRYLVSGNYVVFYRVDDTDVFIDCVLYGRRDYLRILLDYTPMEDTTE